MGCFETFAWLNFGVTHEFEVIANVCGIRLKRNNGNGGVHGINGVLEKGVTILKFDSGNWSNLKNTYRKYGSTKT